MTEDIRYYLCLAITFIIIVWSSVTLATLPAPQSKEPVIEDQIIMASTKTMNISELSNYAIEYGKVKGR